MAYVQARKLFGYTRDEWLRASYQEWQMVLDGHLTQQKKLKEASGG